MHDARKIAVKLIKASQRGTQQERFRRLIANVRRYRETPKTQPITGYPAPQQAVSDAAKVNTTRTWTPKFPTFAVSPELGLADKNDKTRARLFVLFGELDYAGDNNRQNRRDVATKVLGRTVESMKTLTEEEAQQVIAALEKRKAEVKT